MTIATHPTPTDLLDYALGRLSDTASDEITGHLDGCPACAAVLAQLDGEADTLVSQLLGTRPDSRARDSALQAAMQFVKQVGREATAPHLPAGEGRGQGSPLGRLREYELLARLGEGGMGTVYKARHTKLDRVVALKVLTPERMRSADAVARFEREMRAIGKLEHPHIVRAHDAGEFEGTHFLVMEFVAGNDLSELSRQRGPLAVADACELIRQAALGLEYAHEHGLVHRDIKPSNLMLAESTTHHSPTVKILDLGLALLHETESRGELTSTGQMMGTVDYMAPEQGQSSHTVDIRADIYSLGATLYKLLIGVAPLAAGKHDTLMKRLVALATQPHTPAQSLRGDLPDDLARLIDRMLAKEPAARPQTPAEVARLLAPFAAGADLATLALPLPLGEGRGEGVPGEGRAKGLRVEGAIDTSAHLSSSLTGTVSSIAAPPLTIPSAEPAAHAPSTVTLANSTVTTSPPRPQPAGPMWRHPAAIALATALVFLVSVGLYQIVIRIKNPDGTEKIVEVADDAQITIERKAAANTKPAETAKSIPIAPSTLPTASASANLNRAVAEWVLSVGGKVSHETLDPNTAITAISDLPKDSFELRLISLIETPTTDADVARFVGLKKLEAVNVTGTKVTDACLAHLGKIPALIEIQLATIPVSEGSLAHLIQLPNLQRLVVQRIDEAGIRRLGECKQLRSLGLRSPLTEGGANELARMTNLTSLLLDVRTPGPLPAKGMSSIAKLKALNSLALENVHLKQGDYAELISLPELKTLALRSCQLDESMVEELSRLTRLTQLEIATMPLPAQTIPRLTNLTSLSTLRLTKTRLTDEDVRLLSKFPKLRWLILSGTDISDAGATHLEALNSLAALYLDKTGLAPTTVERLRAALPKCSITWSQSDPDRAVAEWVTSVGGKVEVVAGQRRTTTSNPSELPQESFYIRLIDLNYTPTMDEDVAKLEGLQRLEVIYLTNTKVTQACLPHLVPIKSLSEVHLGSTKISEQGLLSLAELPNLTALTLQETSDAGIGTLQRVGTLKTLALNHAPESEAGWTELSRIASLETLILHWSGLRRPPHAQALPAISRLRGLKSLSLSNVCLGSDLARLEELPNLSTLTLGRCDLDVAAKQALPKLSRLNRLVIDLTRLPDRSFAEVAKLADLTDLRLPRMAVATGDIHALISLKKLTRLDLDRTTVTDRAMAYLPQIRGLQSLDLRETATTSEAVAQLKAAMPGCSIQWSPPELDRAAAEWVLSGQDNVGIHKSDETYARIVSKSELPQAPFLVTAISHYGDKRLADGDLARFVGLNHLRELVLNYTLIGDAAMVHIGRMTRLQNLDLMKTNVSDAGMSQLDGSYYLETLNLNQTRVTKYGVARFVSTHPRLKTLTLSGREITDDTASRLATLPMLTSLTLEGCGITDAGLERLAELKNMTTLRLNGSEARITDRGAGSIVELTSLKHLALQNTRLGDAGLAQIARLPQLQILDLGATPVTDAGLVEVAKISTLQDLRLVNTQITDAGLARLHGLTNLSDLDLSKTKATSAGVAAFQKAVPACRIVHETAAKP